jgi:riboflavin kinase/FMN adenylyltransferase
VRIHPGLDAAAGLLKRGAVAIGNFDGVHLGHQALFARSRNRSPAVALTFEPHPARVLAPRYAPPLICVPERKRELIAQCGITDLVEQPFTHDLASLAPDAFVRLVLETGIREVVVGHDFTYGKGRAGSVDTLRAALEKGGAHLTVVPPVSVDGMVCSSTKVREFVLEGRVEAAARLLGRSFDLQGEVVRGAGRGRNLGWPTANIRTANELLPEVGVYAVRARVLPDGAPLAGAANLGLNPTFRSDAALAGAAGRPPLSLEVHLIDFAQDIYGRTLRVEFVERLRAERRFPGIDALKAAIADDVERAKKILGA